MMRKADAFHGGVSWYRSANETVSVAASAHP